MKPGKPSSTTMNEQTFVPANMRALCYHSTPVSNEDLAGMDSTKGNLETNAGMPAQATLETEFPTPRPSAHQYLLKVRAATWGPAEKPFAKTSNTKAVSRRIPLHSVCGTVISTPTDDHIRPGGPQFKIGDEVFGLLSFTRDGGAADYVLATANEIALKPINISATEAAMLVSMIGDIGHGTGSTISREQDGLGRVGGGAQMRAVATTQDGAALAQIASLVEGHKVQAREETVVDLIYATDFLIAGPEDTHGSYGKGVVVRVD